MAQHNNGRVFFELPQEFGTVIYGSDKPFLPRASPEQNPLAVLNEVLTFPLRVFNEGLNLMAQSMGQQNGEAFTKFRRHTAHGELVQTMSTKELKAKNIFGSGGSQ